MNDNNDNWYEPLNKEPAGEQSPYRKTRKNKKIKKSKVFVLILLLLLFGTSVFFGYKSLVPKQDNSSDMETAPAIPDFFSEYFGNGNTEETPTNPQDYPENFGDFFTNYFTKAAGVNIEDYKDKVDFELALLEFPKSEELSLKKLYERCSDTVVGIKAFKGEDEVGYSWGTGVIASSDGIIITNTHVIDEADKAKVILFDDREYDAKLIGFNDITDIAILKIEEQNLPAAEFAETDALKVGDHVAAIGNPLGETFRGTLTDGIISAISREIDFNGSKLTLLQTNTALNEGNSGGPLFNMYGQVIGITNMKMMSVMSNIEGIGFAIPSTTVSSSIDGIVKGSAQLGIVCGAVPETASDYYNIPSGVYIMSVNEKSDAFKKGIKEGDIIIEVNGENVHTTNDILLHKEGLIPGDSMKLTIWRNGATFETEIILINKNDLN